MEEHLNIHFNGVTHQLQRDLYNLSAGIYSVDITDQNGCGLTKSFTIDEPLFPIILSANLTSVECYGTNTGSIDLTISGGSSPYQTQWNSADTTQDIYNLNTGTYSVTIVDNNQCFIDTSFSFQKIMKLQSALPQLTFAVMVTQQD